jgi:hypothetical protein
MYDSVDEIQLISLKKSQGEGAPLPDYDTIGYEKLEVSSPKGPSSDEAPPTKPDTDVSAEYSEVMKKPKPPQVGGNGEYNVLVHGTNPTPQAHQAVVTYAVLNKTSKKEDGAQKTANTGQNEVPPPPLPPPISEDNLHAMKVATKNGSSTHLDTPSQPGQGKTTDAHQSEEMATTKNVSYQNCEPGAKATENGIVSPIPKGTQESTENTGGEIESLYMNFAQSSKQLQ